MLADGRRPLSTTLGRNGVPIRRATDRRPVRTAVLASLLVLGLVLPASSHERSSEDISRELEESRSREEAVKDDLAATEERIDEVAATLSTLETRLRDARARLRQVEGQLAFAQQEHDSAVVRTREAEERLAAALHRLDEVSAKLAAEERILDGQVASAYKYGSATQGQMFLRVIREAESPNDVAVGLYKLRSIVDYQRGIVTRVETLRRDQVEARDEADAHRADAEREQRVAADALVLVRALHAEAQGVADAIGADEAEQRDLLASLESDRAAQQQVLQQVAADQRRLEEEYAAEVARRQAGGAGTCPVEGARVYRDFTNDWGWPRSGGRSHEGTDVFADAGTPVRAMFHGTVKEIRAADRGLGGRIVSYWVRPGEHWYHAHLASVADLEVGDRVAPGTLIGTVGRSGNARTTPPHVHIGHYVEDVARNPFPVLEQACP